MDLNRGDVVRVAEGKPRPAVVIQADGVPTAVMILICPLTSTLIDAPFYRVPITPDARNGLLLPSQVMVDRIGPARRDRIAGVIGRLNEAEIGQVDLALTFILALNG